MKGSALVLAVLLLAFAPCGCGEPNRLRIGDTIPTVTVDTLQGHSMTLPKDIKGKVALLRFWALDCANCDKQLLFSLEALYRKYQDKGFIPVAIHEGRPENCREKLRQFDSLPYPLLLDELRTTAVRFALVGLPTTFLIDRNGTVREKIIGEVGIEEVERLVTTLLK